MSRSYKRTPWCGDAKGKTKKRDANSKVRMFLKNFDNELQYAAYKKVYESWEICDYENICPWEKWWQMVNQRYKKYPNLFKLPNKKEEYRKWQKWYRMK